MFRLAEDSFRFDDEYKDLKENATWCLNATIKHYARKYLKSNNAIKNLQVSHTDKTLKCILRLKLLRIVG